MDNTSPSGGEECGFESRQACQKENLFCLPRQKRFFLLGGETRIIRIYARLHGCHIKPTIFSQPLRLFLWTVEMFMLYDYNT